VPGQSERKEVEGAKCGAVNRYFDDPLAKLEADAALANG